MNTEDAALHLRYTGKHPLRSVYRFIERHGIVVRHDGKRLLLARADVERAIEGGRQTIGGAGQRDQASQSVHSRKCAGSHTSTVRTLSGQLPTPHRGAR